MSAKRMLVDAVHPEETRVIVTDGSRLEEFDFDSTYRRQLRGNIYLAKVMRVEPSLQAAFVDYGGNRHGFLAFSEIHPDYYQIPLADREALLAEEEEAEAEADEIEDLSEADQPAILNLEPADPNPKDESDNEDNQVLLSQIENTGITHADPETGAHDEARAETTSDPDTGDDTKHQRGQTQGDDDEIELSGAEDAAEEVRVHKRRHKTRNYKIQEVIKHRQVILVQVVKEERGGKGAALTTYLSLAGRYSVLMPNTARGGGISRKITNAAHRKRLREIADELDIQKGMGVILRTAGASRTKTEVKRDFEYLLRVWGNVRDLTLASTAPHLVYEEGSLIKRSIRDLYNKDISEVLISGEEAYREAKDFMRMIMPSHAKNVQLYTEELPIFSYFKMEEQLNSMFSPRVTLPSGGYLVINPTEALVSVDVNSGRATKGHNIEETALQTNLEAASELARQLRLRDMAGLVVIDFIDMDEKHNVRAVERKLKESLKSDRSRIQVGHISHFGLLEMSRQRIRFGMLESSTSSCEMCEGTGLVRSVDSLSLTVMRAIEKEVVARKHRGTINVDVPTDVAMHLLNTKRNQLLSLEKRFDVVIIVTANPHASVKKINIKSGDASGDSKPRQTSGNVVKAGGAHAPEGEEEEERAPRKRNRSRRRGGGKTNDIAASENTGSDPVSQNEKSTGEDKEEQPGKRRRRGRRGGRRTRRDQEHDGQLSNQSSPEAAAVRNESPEQTATAAPTTDIEPGTSPDTEQDTADLAVTGQKRQREKSRSNRKGKQDDTGGKDEAASASQANSVKPETKRRKRKPKAEPQAESEIRNERPSPDTRSAEQVPPPVDPGREEGVIVTSSGASESETDNGNRKTRQGWWQRSLFGQK